MSKDLPTTDSYLIWPNTFVDIGKEFWKASTGQPIEERVPDLVARLVGRTDIDVEAAPDLESGYIPKKDLLEVGTTTDLRAQIAHSMRVSMDNLPAHIPENYTPELDTFLKALHESEHVTQHVVEKDPDGSIDVRKSSSWILDYEAIRGSGMANRVMREVDATNAVNLYLRGEGMDDVARFRMDVKTIGSFMNKFPASNILSYDHEVTAIIDHFDKTKGEEVLDPDMIIEEKMSLMQRLQGDFGLGDMWLQLTIMECQGKAQRKPTEEEIGEVIGNLPRITPQKMMHRLQELLDEGELDGLQKLEAENFIAAAERMGYEPDPEPIEEYAQAYTDQMRNMIEQLYGVPDADQAVQNDMKVEASLSSS